MTPELAALATVIDLLSRLEIPYMVTASVAASAHGRPRSTHDADVVIVRHDRSSIASSRSSRTAASTSRDAARSALSQRGQFNVIETAHACKIDLIMGQWRQIDKIAGPETGGATAPGGNTPAPVLTGIESYAYHAHHV